MEKAYFIIGAARSGTTAMANILNTASNAVTYTEQPPKLCVASRMHYEGILPYPKDFIYKSKNNAIEDAWKSGKIYGDKNPNYVYFIKEISELWNSKFLFLIRDGRDVVRSCMDCHPLRGPGYGRYEDSHDSDLAQAEDNFWDFSRLRPRKGSALFHNWRDLLPFEKFAWGWSEFNQILLSKAENLQEDRYMIVDMSTINTETMKEAFAFLNLEGFDSNLIDQMMTSKINTIPLDKASRFPSWEDWDENLINSFNTYAGDMMQRLGYITNKSGKNKSE
ncbi:sulfotransferase [Chloroflexota bacterium]